MNFFNLATAVSFVALMFGVVFWILAIFEGFKFQESVNDLDREIRKHHYEDIAKKHEEDIQAINEMYDRMEKDGQEINATLEKTNQTR